jgi:metal-responsive CopG/Arc/MetJ family transcriptional regulator
MEQITARVETELVEEIDRRHNEHDVSKSEVVRTLLRMGIEHEELQRENERLRNQLQAITSRQQEHTDLVEYVEEERSLSRQKAEAGVVTRAKWWLFGMDDGERSES